MPLGKLLRKKYDHWRVFVLSSTCISSLLHSNASLSSPSCVCVCVNVHVCISIEAMLSILRVFFHLLWIMEDSYLCKTSTVNMLKLLSSVTQDVKKTKLMFVSLQYSITRSKHIHTSLRKKTLEFPSWSFCTSLFLNTISPLFLKCQLRKSYSHHLDVSLFFLPSFPFYYYG